MPLGIDREGSFRLGSEAPGKCTGSSKRRLVAVCALSQRLGLED